MHGAELRKYFEHIFNTIETNLCSFERDYYDVENFYSLIQIGTREKDKVVLLKKCWDLLSEYDGYNLTGTPDFGGALCVIGYNDTEIDLDFWLDKTESYLDNMNFNNPHCIRWAISLSYLAGTLTNKVYWFKKCVSYDWKKFNTLILTKVLMSYEKLARMEMDNDHRQSAKKYINTALEIYKTGLSQDLDDIVGNRHAWVYFGFCELALLSNMASQLVVFLQNINIYGTEEFEEKFDGKRFGMLKWCQKLEKEVQYLKERQNDFA